MVIFCSFITIIYGIQTLESLDAKFRKRARLAGIALFNPCHAGFDQQHGCGQSTRREFVDVRCAFGSSNPASQ